MKAMSKTSAMSGNIRPTDMAAVLTPNKQRNILSLNLTYVENDMKKKLKKRLIFLYAKVCYSSLRLLFIRLSDSGAIPRYVAMYCCLTLRHISGNIFLK